MSKNIKAIEEALPADSAYDENETAQIEFDGQQTDDGDAEGGGGASMAEDGVYTDEGVVTAASPPMMDDEETGVAAAPVDPDMIKLSMADTLNLLEPDTRILTDEEQTALNEEEATEINKKYLEPWARRVHPLVHTLIAAVQDEKATEDEAGAPAGATGDGGGGEQTADGASAASRKSKKSKADLLPLDKYEKQALALSMRYSDGIMHPGSMHMEQKSPSKYPQKSLLLFNTIGLIDATQGEQHQSNLFGRAMQRIGHRVLLGHFEIIGNIVTMPGLCAADATPASVEHVDTANIDHGKVTMTQKKELDCTAAVFLERTGNNCTRLAKVELLQITLAQYVELLRGELERASKGKFDKDKVKKSILAAILDRITVAESYYKPGATPATDYVLPHGKPINPHKVMLDIHQYRLVQNEALHALTIFDACFKKVDPKAASASTEKMIQERIKFLAKNNNHTQTTFRFSYLSRPRADGKQFIEKPAPMMIQVYAPIVPNQVFFREANGKVHGEIILPAIEAARKEWGHCCDDPAAAAAAAAAGNTKSAKSEDNAADEDDDIDDKVVKPPPAKKAAVAAPTDNTPKKTADKPAAPPVKAVGAAATSTTTTDKVKQVAERAEKTAAKVTFAATKKSATAESSNNNDDDDDGATASDAGDADDDDVAEDEEAAKPVQRAPAAAAATPAKSALKQPTPTAATATAAKPAVKPATTPPPGAKASAATSATKPAPPGKPATQAAAAVAPAKPSTAPSVAKSSAPTTKTPAAAAAPPLNNKKRKLETIEFEFEPFVRTEDQQDLLMAIMPKLEKVATLPDDKRLGLFANYKKGMSLSKEQNLALYNGYQMLCATGLQAMPALIVAAEKNHEEKKAAHGAANGVATDVATATEDPGLAFLFE